MILQLLLLAALGAASAQELEALLSLADSAKDDQLNILFELYNPSQETLSIDRYFTPLSGIRKPVFRLTQGGDVVKYTGIWALHQESKDLYLSLAPGETLSVTVDIADYYDISSGGDYSLSWKYGGGNELALDVSPFLKRAPKILEHWKCTDFEKDEIAVADEEALMQASSAIRCLDRESCDEMAGKWFGQPFGNYASVRYKYKRIKETIEEGYQVECGGSECTPGTYAYVYPNDDNLRSYLCEVFWQLPGERGETVLHELSHFSDVAGTVDTRYGRSPCLELAIDSPELARNNADNLGYFGKDASVTIDECFEDNPCQNGGTCVDTNRRLCECASGFTGDLCDDVSNPGSSPPSLLPSAASLLLALALALCPTL